MRGKIKNVTVRLLILLVAILFFKPDQACAAGKRVIPLRSGRVYSYDLNGDNKAEKIMLLATGTFGDLRVRIYIDSRQVFSKSIDEDHEGPEFISFFLLDLNKKDKYTEVYFDYEDFGGSYHAHLLRYTGKKMKVIMSAKDTNIEGCEFSLLDPVQSGNGKLTYRARAATKTGFDVMVKYEMDIKNGTLKKTSTTYESINKKAKYRMVVKKKATVKKNGGRAAFIAKKGSRIQVLKVHIAKPKNNMWDGFYLYVKNTKGKKGWIKTKMGAEFINVY